MSTFYLLDHSLKGVGGHHFDYAFQVLQAASDAGWRIVLATNRRFHDRARLPADWLVESPFRFTTYCRFAGYQSSHGRAIRSLDPPRVESPLAAGIDHGPTGAKPAESRRSWLSPGLDRVSRYWRLRHFASACRRLFRKYPLRAGDHVFLPTLSEFDLQGLLQFLASDPNSVLAQWHLQFHYNVYEGRETDYELQPERLAAMRDAFVLALRPIAGHRLHFYTTSSQLAGQYSRLQVGQFHNLTYPISAAFHVESQPAANGPLRVTCPGAVREEKGQTQLAEVLAQLWDDHFATGKLQLVVQSNKSWFQLPVPRRGSAVAAHDPVAYVPHPLAPREYVELIRQADIGLLLYDSRRYFARRAGILGELLSAGVPVIVPAGCWLSEQIAEAGFTYRDSLLEHWPALECHRLECLPAELPPDRRAAPRPAAGPNGISSGAGLELAVPAGATNLVVHWQRGLAQPPGSYVRLRADWHRSATCTTRVEEIVGDRMGNRPASAGLVVPAGTRRVTLAWSNAYADEQLALQHVRAAFLDASRGPGGHCATSSVGVAFAEPAEVPRLLREMVQQNAHYRQSAQQFARSWQALHSAEQTVAQLLNRSQLAQQPVAA